MKRPARDGAAREASPRGEYTTKFLEFFYPVYYRLGRALEDVMGRGRLTRKQVAVLWLIRSEGENGRSLPRKRIERLIKGWFEVTGSAVTKTIRPMATELGLIRLVEDPRSGREKQVVLTDAGQALIGEMIEAGGRLIDDVARHLGTDELRSGMAFLAKATDGLDQVLNSLPPSLPRRRRRSVPAKLE